MNNSYFFKVHVGNIYFKKNHYVIQSMTNTKTTKISQTIKQINQLCNLGCKIVRIAINNNKDVLALKKITNRVNCPIVADIHYNFGLAIESLKNGAKGIRINPGNTKINNQFYELIELAKEKDACIRFGLNTGSLNIFKNIDNKVISLFQKYIQICEKKSFYNIVLSVKTSNVNQSIHLNELIAKKFKYPIHIGLTEAGDLKTSLIKSTLALSPLIKKNIGSTIRISIGDNPLLEPIAAKILLNELGIKQKNTKLIACPTCGRTHKNYWKLQKALIPFIEKNPKENYTVAIMGCTINGINESKQANIGLTCNKRKILLFKRGKLFGKFSLKKSIKLFKNFYLA